MSINYSESLNRLPKDSRRRLDKLREEWDKDTSAYLLEKLTLPDLRLLLENFTPLQNLIRQLAAGVPSTGSDRTEPEAVALSSGAKLPQPDSRHHQQEMALLRQQLSVEQQQRRAVETQAQRLQLELDAARRERDQQTATTPVLSLLRKDATLAGRLGLESLPQDSTQALIRAVAVLSQITSIERLWDALKERSEREQRAADAEEQVLLASAVEWHNHNWRQKPYALTMPSAGEPFSFNLHQRSASAMSGESVAACWLPGIADGNGKPLRKALIVTR